MTRILEPPSPNMATTSKNGHIPTASELIDMVDKVMLDSVHSNVQLLQDASTHIISAGGKRVRPRMLLLAYLGLGGTNLDKALPVAASVELVHTASVVHDDINDHGVMRRGRPSINAKWGRTFALLTGDFLFTKVYELMADYSNANKIMAKATMALVEGETLQAAAVKEKNLTQDVYMRVIALKTAELFRASAQLGALLAGSNEKTQQALAEYGFNVGMAFQIIDDILDITADPEELGKTSGIDVEQGKGIASIEKSVDPMEKIRAEVLKGDAIERGNQIAQQFVDMAIERLEAMPDGTAKNELIAIAHAVINRKN